MIKNLFFSKSILLLLFLISSLSFAQIGINTTDPKTTLDVEYNPNSTSAVPPGIRAPNLSLNQLLAINNIYGSPQQGAFVYITDVNDLTTTNITNITAPGYYFFDGTNWNVFALPKTQVISTEPWYNFETHEAATGNNQNLYQNAQVGIGLNTTINPNAQLQIVSDSKGLLIPNLTTSQRNNIVNPANSLLIWNTDDECFNFYKNALVGWKQLCENIAPAEFTIIQCENSIVNGTYQVGKTTDTTNFIQVTVDVTKAGNYNIEGTTEYGIFFQKSGTFPKIGKYTITIPAYGSPTQATPVGTNAIIKLTLNDTLSPCELKITTIDIQNVSYTINNAATDIIPESITRGVSTLGKSIEVKLKTSVGGSTNLTATDTQGFGIVYYAYNQNLTNPAQNSTVENTVTLYSNGNSVPVTYLNANNELTFNLEGVGLNPTPVTFPISLGTQNAIATCTNIQLNGNYVFTKNLTADNYIKVTLNVTTPGAYTFFAKNDNANIKFESTGAFTTIGTKTITIPASTITNGPLGAINDNSFDYDFTPTLNGATMCPFSLDIIYSAKKVLLFGTYSVAIQQTLNNLQNFGPNGTLRIEALNSQRQDNPNLTAAGMLNYINNDNYQMIVFPVTMGKFTITDDVYQILANFITKKKGIVIFTSGTAMQTHIQGILNKLYPNQNITLNNSTYNIQATALPIDSPTTNNNPYLKGLFGTIYGRYFLGYDANSWLGINGTPPSGLKTLVNLPPNGTSTARSTFIYTETPGLFAFPGYISLFEQNSAYGYAAPIQANNGNWNAPYLYNGNNIETNVTLSPGMSVGYQLLGNVIAESFRHLEQNYDSNVTITSQP